MSDKKTALLCVDDEPNILDGLKRQLREHFDVTTAIGGVEGLKVFKEVGPFPIVVSDLRMPEMDGVAFLGQIKQTNADTVRVLLTGQADLNSAISAVNEGHIFRFLTKPCPADILLKSLKAAEEQYNLITAEKILLEQTLQGSIRTLTDILSLASPHIFARANRIKLYAKPLISQLNVENKWMIEVAAMLSQIGIITLPDEMVIKLHKNEALKKDEQEMIDELPSIAEKLLSHIPRLEPVRQILLYQDKLFDGSGFPKDNVRRENIPLGSRILKILQDYEKLESIGYSSPQIFNQLYERKGWYDEKILKTFSILRGTIADQEVIKDVSVAALRIGMILTEDIFTKDGALLVKHGLEITEPLLARIQNFAKQRGIKGTIKVK